MIVRRIRPDEWRALREIRLRALAEDPYAFGSPLAREQAKDDQWWQEWADEDARSPDCATFVAAEGDRWVGVVACFREDEDKQLAKIVAMWVEPRARRRGVADRLLETTERWLVERGVREIRLSVSNVNDAASSLYAKHGYRPTGKTKPLASNPSLTEIEMMKVVRTDRAGGRDASEVD